MRYSERGCFNPVLGFLPASTRYRFASRERRRCFNPVLGFLPASTGRRIGTTPGLPLFQSRSGFSPCLDPRPPLGRIGRVRVSIPFWVFSLPRPSSSHRSPAKCVSIPFWVFSLPRLTTRTVRRRSSVVSIPFWVFSLPRLRRSPSPFTSTSRFNPVLGFLPASTRRRSSRYARMRKFQSRSGFSPCLDPLGRPRRCCRSSVSIPFWVFSLPRRARHCTGASPSLRFNPVLGFLPASTGASE